ncbi:hypothetical protein [[Bacillus] enclensis]|nr:hypothetical protein [[Bacillus] enclensis]
MLEYTFKPFEVKQGRLFAVKAIPGPQPHPGTRLARIQAHSHP